MASKQEEIWKRQSYDTSASFNAFHKYYLSQDPPRSVDEAYRRWYVNRHGKGTEKARKAPGIWKKWAWPADNPSWQQRAQAFDDHLAALQRAEWERQHMNDAEVLARLAGQARSDIGEFAHIESDVDLEDHPFSNFVKKFKKRVWYTKDGDRQESIELELYDSQVALVHLGRHHGVFDADASEDNPQFNVEITLEEWKAKQEKVKQQAQGTIADFEGGENE